MSLNDLADEFGDEIEVAAENLVNSLPLSKPQVRSVFSEEEIKKVDALLRSVNAASSENEKQTKLMENVEAALILFRKLGIMP